MRGVSLPQIHQLIAEHTESWTLVFLGEPRVNVLMLNLAFDQQFPRKHQ